MVNIKEKEKTEIFITRLTDENIDNFIPLISDYMRGSLDLDGYYGLGAIIETSEGFIPVGTLVFELASVAAADGYESMMKLCWIYVDENNRREGVGTELMEQFLSIADDAGKNIRVVDVPLASEYDQVISFMEACGFQFILADESEFDLSSDMVGEWKNKIKKYDDIKVMPLSDIPTAMFKEYMEYFDGDLDFASKDVDTYDPEKSFGIVEGKELYGALLTFKRTDVDYDLVLAHAFGEYGQEGIDALFYCLSEAIGNEPEAILHIDIMDDIVFSMMEKVDPTIQIRPVRRGIRIEGFEFVQDEEDVNEELEFLDEADVEEDDELPEDESDDDE